MIICADEVVFDPASVIDPNGRVFWWRGEVYRGITEGAASLYRTLLESGAFEGLVDAGMIGTEMTSFSLEGYDLILSHDTVRFRSYPFEWCDEMLKDAALLTCDVNLALASIGLSAHDAHGWNVLFDGPTPKFVDVGSIRPGRLDPASLTGWYRQFQDCFLYPLHLMAAGQGGLARLLLADADGVVGRHGIAKMLPVTKRIECRLEGFRDSPGRFRSETSFLERLRSSVEDIRLPETAAAGSGYYDEQSPSFESSEDWSIKHRTVFEILQRLHPSSVVDVGHGEGWYSRLAASLGIPVVAFDVDEVCVRSLYLDASKTGSHVLPLTMDVCNPSSRTGRSHGGFFPSAQERLKGELVLGLDVVRHLVLDQGIGLDETVAKLGAFTSRWLLIEFAPPTDGCVGARCSDRYSWYSLDSFVGALRRHFGRVELFDSFPAPGQLLLCELPGAGRSESTSTPAPPAPVPEMPVRDGARPEQGTDCILRFHDVTSESLAALAVSGVPDRRLARLAAWSSRRYAQHTQRHRAPAEREELEVRLCRGDLRDARKEFLRVRPHYLSRTKFFAATPMVMASPRLYASVLRRVRARRFASSAANDRR
jgi:hypothetical protein